MGWGGGGGDADKKKGRGVHHTQNGFFQPYRQKKKKTRRKKGQVAVFHIKEKDNTTEREKTPPNRTATCALQKGGGEMGRKGQWGNKPT